MADANPSRVGQINLAGDVDAIFLKVFGGEVLMTFEQTVTALDKTTVRNISSGKSASFPKIGNVGARYHVPGTEILGQNVASGEIIVTINGFLISDVFIADIDEAKSHFEVRQMYSKKAGEALATQMDRHILQTGIQAAQAGSTLTGDNGGTVITSANAGTTADDLVKALFDAAVVLDQKNVPAEDRFAYLKPVQYALLANSSKAINVDFGNDNNGSTATGKVYQVAGLTLVKTNQLPTTNVTAAPAAGDTALRQAVNAANTVCLVMHKSAVATVKLRDISMRLDYDPRRLGWLMVAKYAVGHAPLRPEAAVQIKTA